MSEDSRPRVVLCQRCGRWTRLGQPYVMLGPGKFAHRGPCVVLRATLAGPGE